MPGDIVQVIERAMAIVEEAKEYPDYLPSVADNRDSIDHDLAQLRAFRDRIVEDQKANAEWKKTLASGWDSSNGRPAAFDIALDAERALLASCREVGT